MVYLCYCFLQSVYTQYDTDRSGVINSHEVPAAFKAAGDKRSSVCVFVCVFVSEKGVQDLKLLMCVYRFPFEWPALQTDYPTLQWRARRHGLWQLHWMPSAIGCHDQWVHSLCCSHLPLLVFVTLSKTVKRMIVIKQLGLALFSILQMLFLLKKTFIYKLNLQVFKLGFRRLSIFIVSKTK